MNKQIKKVVRVIFFMLVEFMVTPTRLGHFGKLPYCKPQVTKDVTHSASNNYLIEWKQQSLLICIQETLLSL